MKSKYYWKKTHWDNYTLSGDVKDMLKFRSSIYVQCLDGNKPLNFRTYEELQNFCNRNNIDPIQS